MAAKGSVGQRGFFSFLWQIFLEELHLPAEVSREGWALSPLPISSCDSRSRRCLLCKLGAFQKTDTVLASWKNQWALAKYSPGSAVPFISPHKTQLCFTTRLGCATLVPSVPFITAVNFICLNCAVFHTYGRHLQPNITAKHNGAN